MDIGLYLLQPMPRPGPASKRSGAIFMTEEIQNTENTENSNDSGSLIDNVDQVQESTEEVKDVNPLLKPDWLSDDLWDKEKNALNPDAALKKIQEAEKHEKMSKDLRDKLARRGLPPEDPKDYKINIEDKAWKDDVHIPDEVLGKVKETAHKLGISQAQFGPLAEAYLEAIATLASEPEKMTEEQKSQAAEVEKSRQASEIAKLGANGPQVIQAVSGMLREMKAQGVITDAEMSIARDIAKTAEGVQFLNAMRERMGGDHVPMADIDPDNVGGVSHSAIQDFMNTPEYRRGDQAAVEKYERMIEQTIKAGNPFKYKI